MCIEYAFISFQDILMSSPKQQAVIYTVLCAVTLVITEIYPLQFKTVLLRRELAAMLPVTQRN